MENNKDSNDELAQVLEILDEIGIDFWMCHGSLLGLIRDGELLAWDDDIDIGIWDSKSAREKIEKAFQNRIGYERIYLAEEIFNIHFLTARKRLDFNFYNADKNSAFIRWVNPNISKNKLIILLIRGLDSNYSATTEFIYARGAKSQIKYFIVKILNIISFLIPKSILSLIVKGLSKALVKTGYTYPLELMKFERRNFGKLRIPVPVDSEAILKHNYGPDWRTPNRNFVWYEDASNLS